MESFSDSTHFFQTDDSIHFTTNYKADASPGSAPAMTAYLSEPDTMAMYFFPGSPYLSALTLIVTYGKVLSQDTAYITTLEGEACVLKFPHSATQVGGVSILSLPSHRKRMHVIVDDPEKSSEATIQM
jgi:hypothetical protein